MALMDLSTRIVNSTLRIRTTGASGQGSGTGFIVSFPTEKADGAYLFLITNKHVIAGASEASVRVTLRKKGTEEPDYGRNVVFPLPGEQGWTLHPDPQVDLAMLPAHAFWHALESNGELPALVAVPSELFVSNEVERDLTAVESILMVGYPNGLADEVNNLPVARRGITATPAAIDFEGRPQFVIDCAVFPGSSGSPIFLYDGTPMRPDKGGWSIGGPPRCYLLGVLWGGPLRHERGVIEPAPVPTSNTLVARMQLLMNLGYCVKAREILWFEEEWKRQIAAATK